MTKRIDLSPGLPKAFKALLTMADEVARAGAGAGVAGHPVRTGQDRGVAAQRVRVLPGHAHADAVRLGEDPRRIYLLDAWRETALFSEQERAALELTEVLTRCAAPGRARRRVRPGHHRVHEDQYKAVAWMIVVINNFNRLAIPSRPELPRRAA